MANEYNLADWYSGGMAPPMVAGSGLIPRPIPSAAGSTVQKTYTTRLGQDFPSSQAALAINGMFGRGLPETAMAYAPTTASVPLPRPRPGSAPNAMDLAAMAAPPATMTSTGPRMGSAMPATLAQPERMGGLIGLLLGNNAPSIPSGGLLGMLTAPRGAKDRFRAAMTGQQPQAQRITGQGGGGAFFARAGSPASDAGAGSGSLLPASMNSTRWTTGY